MWSNAMTTKQKQALLSYLGYYAGLIDGVWGQQSQRATIDFQRAYMDSADGIFGAATEKRILEVVASGEKPKESFNAETADWWKDIRYFTRAEFRCPCPRCGGFPVEPEEKLVRLADQVREHFVAPMTISSGVRCQAHNDELRGSAPNSYHVSGKAIDFTVRGKTATQVLAYVMTLPVHYAYAIDESFVHMDVN